MGDGNWETPIKPAQMGEDLPAGPIRHYLLSRSLDAAFIIYAASFVAIT